MRKPPARKRKAWLEYENEHKRVYTYWLPSHGRRFTVTVLTLCPMETQ